MAREDLDDFLRTKDFAGLNVTIPYKERVIPYLDFIDVAAKEIGAVNTVVNRGGMLYGYNTDFYGMEMLCSLRLENPDISLDELGKMMNPELSRSAVSRRFKKLEKIAAELKTK